MNKIDVVENIIDNKKITIGNKSFMCFAPINIALIKYWGKSDLELNLPMTPSISITSVKLGTKTRLTLSLQDECFFNNKKIQENSVFFKNIFSFLDLFRKVLHINDIKFCVNTTNNIPIASGVASSASGFCALSFAVNSFFNLHLTHQQLATIARLGSGSACRSVYGKKYRFISWNKDVVKPILIKQDDFKNNICMFILLLSSKVKSISSRDAMEITKNNSTLYQSWILQTKQDYENLLKTNDFDNFGIICENNAILLHQSIQEVGIHYFNTRTTKMIEWVYKSRKKGLKVYFTIDAGANVCIFFQKQDKQLIFDELLFSKLVSKNEILEF